MPVSREFLDHVADQLRGFGPMAVRRMFGGAGLFRGALMFGLVADDVLYFKVGATDRDRYAAAGARPFTYRRRGAAASLPSYYEVPASVLDEPDILAEWAQAAWAAAQAAKPKRGSAKEKRIGALCRPVRRG